MKFIKLQTLTFMTCLFLAVSVICSLSFFFYTYISKILIERETAALINLNNSFKVQVEQVIKEMDTVSINISYSSLVKDKIDEDFNLDVSRDDFKALTNLFVTINGADLKVDQINLYDFNGNVISVGISSLTQKVDLSTLDWLEETVALNGSKLISSPYQMTSIHKPTNQPAWFISLYRVYKNEYGDTVGVIETVKQCKSVFKSIISYTNKEESPPNVYVYDNQGSLLYPYDLQDDESTVLFDYFSILEPTHNHFNFNNPLTQTNETIIYEKSHFTNWTYVTVESTEKILAPVNEFLKILLGVSFIILCIIVLIAYYLSRLLTHPLEQLCSIIYKTEIHNLGTEELPLIDTKINEISKLNLAFLNMSQKLKLSLSTTIEAKQQELKSRNLALQSQINPHFYHNTLSTIVVLSENNDCNNVIKMCRNLSSIMRYVTDSTSTTTLQEEITYVEQYLSCMKIRYQSSLHYTLQIAPELLEIEVPKLIIQPLVENALKYSTHCEPPWNLSIVSHITEDSWEISVIDSGTGFTESSLTTFNERIQAASDESNPPPLHIDGMGLLNVYYRWKLFCTDTMIFHVGNHKLGGGIVTLGKRRPS